MTLGESPRIIKAALALIWSALTLLFIGALLAFLKDVFRFDSIEHIMFALGGSIFMVVMAAVCGICAALFWTFTFEKNEYTN